MIKGLTHELDGTPNRTTRYRGKISTGFAPGEGPNKAKHPIAAGFFRMLKEVTRTVKVGKGQEAIKEWVLNEELNCQVMPIVWTSSFSVDNDEDIFFCVSRPSTCRWNETVVLREFT